MAEVGRPSLLSNELKVKIRREIINSGERPTIAKVSEISGIGFDTVKNWIYSNYEDFQTFFDGLKRDWKLKKAEENLEEFLVMDTKNQLISKKGDVVEYNDPKILKIKADTTFFVSETLGKKNYSKRSELTGADGDRLIPKPLLGGQSNVSNNDSDNQAITTEEEN